MHNDEKHLSPGWQVFKDLVKQLTLEVGATATLLSVATPSGEESDILGGLTTGETSYCRNPTAAAFSVTAFNVESNPLRAKMKIQLKISKGDHWPDVLHLEDRRDRCSTGIAAANPYTGAEVLHSAKLSETLLVVYNIISTQNKIIIKNGFFPSFSKNSSLDGGFSKAEEWWGTENCCLTDRLVRMNSDETYFCELIKIEEVAHKRRGFSSFCPNQATLYMETAVKFWQDYFKKTFPRTVTSSWLFIYHVAILIHWQCVYFLYALHQCRELFCVHTVLFLCSDKEISIFLAEPPKK